MQATGLQGGRVLNPNDRAKRARARACFAISYAFALSALGAPALGCAMMCVRCRRPPSNACRLQTTQLPFAATERARRTVLEPRLSRREAAAAAASYWPHQHAAPEPDVMPRCFTALLCLGVAATAVAPHAALARPLPAEVLQLHRAADGAPPRRKWGAPGVASVARCTRAATLVAPCFRAARKSGPISSHPPQPCSPTALAAPRARPRCRRERA